MTYPVRTSPIPLNKIDQFVLWLCRHWVGHHQFLGRFYVLVPFLAPVLMALGLTFPGKAVYRVYSFLCHQLPERSYFLLGPKISYTLTEIQSVWQNTNDFAVLRQFLGSSQMGWKVAWSDRMVSMFTSLWLFGVLWGIFKRKMNPLPWWGLVFYFFLYSSMATHMVSDLAGIGQGFRDSNAWLVMLTNNTLPAAFYAGDAWGSFNAWMRLMTGVLFGLGIVWFGFPYLDIAFTNSAQVVEYKYQYRAWLQMEKKRLLKLL